MLTDASITFHCTLGVRIRAGLLKLPASEEALVRAHTSYRYVNSSNVAANLLVESQVEAAGAVNAAGIEWRGRQRRFRLPRLARTGVRLGRSWPV